MILFSIARLIYTFPHDTMEYDKYYLQSEDFIRKDRKKPISFKILYKWNKKIYYNYNNVFKDFIIISIKKLFYKKLNKIEFLRFNLTLILCFLRGINANHQPKINFLEQNLTISKIKVFLYICFF